MVNKFSSIAQPKNYHSKYSLLTWVRTEEVLKLLIDFWQPREKYLKIFMHAMNIDVLY